MSIRAIVVDDEPLARELVCDLLLDYPEIQVTASCADGRSAAEAIGRIKPELLFLDVRMAQSDGFDLLERVRSDGWDPYVIFVTAYDRYAVRAFDVDAVDYLLKPVERERFRQSIRRARSAILGGDDGGIRAIFPRSFEVREGRKIKRIRADEIVWIESANQYATIHTPHGETVLARSLSSLMSDLDPRRFCRVHRSAIVRIETVQYLRVEANGARSVSLSDGTRLPVSRRRRLALERRLRAANWRPLPEKSDRSQES